MKESVVAENPEASSHTFQINKFDEEAKVLVDTDVRF